MWEELGYTSRDDLIVNGYELDPSEVNLAAQWLKIKDPGAEVGFDHAVQEGIKVAKVQAEEISQGTRTDLKDETSLYDNEVRQGTSKSYLLRRMARDFPEVLDQIETGEFKSTRQAAIHCGIIKVKTPLEIALAAFRKLTGEEKEIFEKEVMMRFGTHENAVVPKRIKWNRSMGRMPEGAVLVTRRSRYGNFPYPVPKDASRDVVQQAVDNYERDLLSGDLRSGKDGRYNITVD